MCRSFIKTFETTVLHSQKQSLQSASTPTSFFFFFAGFAGLDNDRAVCDFGIKEFNHELVLQSVKEVNVPHSWPIFGEYMGDLYT